MSNVIHVGLRGEEAGLRVCRPSSGPSGMLRNSLRNRSVVTIKEWRCYHGLTTFDFRCNNQHTSICRIDAQTTTTTRQNNLSDLCDYRKDFGNVQLVLRVNSCLVDHWLKMTNVANRCLLTDSMGIQHVEEHCNRRKQMGHAK